MPDDDVTDELAAVVLAAGAGTRLRPLTDILPKALCPVDNVALVDLAIDRVRPLTQRIAVNVHHGRTLLEARPGPGRIRRRRPRHRGASP